MVPQDAVQTLGSDSVVFVRTGRLPRPAHSDRQPMERSPAVSPPAQIATTNAFLLKAEIEKESAE
jgi:cobalt-zinc-cadmium efflux system membrane fusion protein